jgi:2'-5' RNA ligase
MAGSLRDLRLFIALDLPADVRALLAEVTAGLSHLGNVRWVRSEGVHLTLKFLGGTPGSLVPRLAGGLEQIARETPAFSLETAGAGTFGGRNTRVVWVGVAGDTGQLAELARRTDQMTESLGFPGENREFRAHLTLGRVRDEASPADRQAIRDAVAGLTLRSVRFQAGELVLFRSQLQAGGAAYTALHSFALGGADREGPGC